MKLAVNAGYFVCLVFPPPPSNDDIYDGVDDDPHDRYVFCID